MFRRIRRHRDHHFIKNTQAARDNVGMAVGNGIKRAWVDADLHTSSQLIKALIEAEHGIAVLIPAFECCWTQRVRQFAHEGLFEHDHGIARLCEYDGWYA